MAGFQVTTEGPDPIVAGVKADKQFNTQLKHKGSPRFEQPSLFATPQKLVHFPPTADKRETLYIRTVFPAKAKSIRLFSPISVAQDMHCPSVRLDRNLLAHTSNQTYAYERPETETQSEVH